MLQLRNLTRFAVQAAPLVDPDGAHVWTVVVKVTYAFGPQGRLSYAEEQEAVHLAPVYAGAAGASTLLRDGEMVHEHPGTDVLVNGAAHVPEPATECEIALEVGRHMRKSLRVTGERHWVAAGVGDAVELSDPEPFESMPVTWERAFGGPRVNPAGSFEERNPVGVGVAQEPRLLAGTRAPNIEMPGGPLDPNLGVCAEPAGLAAVPPQWMPRRKLAGTFDEQWRSEKAPFWPDDYDPHHACSAPEGQRVEPALTGGEAITLFNLMRGEPVFCFRVPRERITVHTELGGMRIRRAPTLDRLIIEPDDSKLVAVWRMSLPCGNDVRTVRGSIVQSKRAATRVPARRRTTPTTGPS